MAFVSCATEVLSAPADPHANLLAAFHRVTAAWLAMSEDEQAPEARALWAEWTRLERQIEEMVARTPAGIAAQIEYATAEYGNGLLDPTPETHFDVPAALLDVILTGVRGL